MLHSDRGRSHRWRPLRVIILVPQSGGHILWSSLKPRMDLGLIRHVARVLVHED